MKQDCHNHKRSQVGSHGVGKEAENATHGNSSCACRVSVRGTNSVNWLPLPCQQGAATDSTDSQHHRAYNASLSGMQPEVRESRTHAFANHNFARQHVHCTQHPWRSDLPLKPEPALKSHESLQRLILAIIACCVTLRAGKQAHGCV